MLNIGHRQQLQKLGSTTSIIARLLVLVVGSSSIKGGEQNLKLPGSGFFRVGLFVVVFGVEIFISH